MAFGEVLSVGAQVALIQRALTGYVHGANRTTMLVAADQYKGALGRVKVVDVDPTWPTGFPRPENVPRFVSEALARGSSWHFGELLPTLAIPSEATGDTTASDAFRRIVADAAGANDFVATSAIVTRLEAEGAITGNPSPAQRAAMRSVLTEARVQARRGHVGWPTAARLAPRRRGRRGRYVMISLTSAALAVSSSPQTQLVKVRLAITTGAAAVTGADAWPYSLQVDGSPVEGIPYFRSPTDPATVGP